jgi:hypothetical protein
MLVFSDAEHFAAGPDVEELLCILEAARPGASRGATDEPLRETLRPVTAIDRDGYVGVVDRSTTSWT